MKILLMLTTSCIAWQGLCYLVGRDRLDCIKNIASIFR